jgi:SAM-dependent methyltransferase
MNVVREALRSGYCVDDRAFDRVYPLGVRRASRIFWTPVDVAMRAARLLADRPGLRVLDVGSGVGKFCIVAAATVNASVIGLEHRPHLVAIAKRAAARIGVNVDFKVGTLGDCDPRDIDCVYLFNPFSENLAPAEDHLDESVELSERRFWRDIARMELFLRAASVGTRVVTYCGWGGAMPSEYRLERREAHAGTLELWIKTNGACSFPRLGRASWTALRERALAGVKT